MKRVRETELYESVLKELNYNFGNIYIFQGFVVSEINEGVNFNWEEHGKLIVNDVTAFIGTTGENVIYISNRIHSYSVVPTDWLKFYMNNYVLKQYYIVSHQSRGIFNSLIEDLFFKHKIKRFDSLLDAINAVENENESTE